MTDHTRSSLELLINVSRELSTALDLHTVLPRILTLSTGSVQAERGSVIVMDEQQQPVDAAIVYEGRLTPHTLDQLKSTLEQGLAGWVVRTRQSALLPDTSQDPRWMRRPDDEHDATGAKSAICVPVMVRDELVGVLTLVHATPNFFGKEHLALIRAIADQAGIAVHNARLYDSLQSARQRYQELFEESIDPILVTNLEGKIQEANREAVVMSNRSPDMLRGCRVWDLHSGTADWLHENMQAIEAGQTVSCEAELFPLNLDPIPIEVHVHQIRFPREVLLQWIIRDISERKQLDTLRNDLTAMIYHDLRSPLANIVSSLDMLRVILPDGMGENQNDIVGQVLAIAIRSSDRMQRLISSLLDINRLEEGQPIGIRKTVQVSAILNEALESIHPLVSAKSQKIILDMPAVLPGILVDEDMIRRVLINLLENANKFTGSGGSITVGARDEGESVRLWVKDTGPGIPHEAQDRVFLKFSRVVSDRSTGAQNPGFQIPKGLGLGLAFCKLAVEAHGGVIGVESEPGEGSCFYFTIPSESS